MDRLTEQDFVNASRPIVRLTLENMHLRTALAHAKQQNDANESLLNDAAQFIGQLADAMNAEPQTTIDNLSTATLNALRALGTLFGTQDAPNDYATAHD